MKTLFKVYTAVIFSISFFIFPNEISAKEVPCSSEKAWWPICNISNKNLSNDLYEWTELFQSERDIKTSVVDKKAMLQAFKHSVSNDFYLYKDAHLSCPGAWGDVVRACLLVKLKFAADAGSGDAAYEYYELTRLNDDSREYLLLSAKNGNYSGRLTIAMDLIENGKTPEERKQGIEYLETLVLERKEMINTLVKYEPLVKNDIDGDRILVWQLLSELNKQQADIEAIKKIRGQIKDWSVFCSSLANLAREAQVDSMPENNQAPEFAKQIVEITINCVQQ